MMIMVRIPLFLARPHDDESPAEFEKRLSDLVRDAAARVDELEREGGAE